MSGADELRQQYLALSALENWADINRQRDEPVFRARALGVSQVAIAEALGVSIPTVTRIYRKEKRTHDLGTT